MRTRYQGMLFALVVAAAGSIVLSQPAMASGWTPELTITSAFTEDSDILVIYTSGGSVYTPGCTANDWIFRASNEDRRGRAWATILSGLTTGMKIKFYYGDTCDSWNFHKATAVTLVR